MQNKLSKKILFFQVALGNKPDQVEATSMIIEGTLCLSQSNFLNLYIAHKIFKMILSIFWDYVLFNSFFWYYRKLEKEGACPLVGGGEGQVSNGGGPNKILVYIKH